MGFFILKIDGISRDFSSRKLMGLHEFFHLIIDGISGDFSSKKLMGFQEILCVFTHHFLLITSVALSLVWICVS